MQIEISGIKIELQKKNIKNLHLVVAPPGWQGARFCTDALIR